MIEWRLLPEDVARIRFAFSPLFELVLSLVTLRTPADHTLHRSWARATRSAVADLDLAELFALVPAHGLIADFISAAPSQSRPDFATEIDVVRQTEPERVIADLDDVTNLPEAVANQIRADPKAAIIRIADALQAYWDEALAPHWPRIQRLLEADVLWRSEHLASEGLHGLFSDLHDTVTLDGDRLVVADAWDYSGQLTGTGLTLVPHAMGWPMVRKMTGRRKPGMTGEPYQPMIAYPVRGIATLWEAGPPAPPDSLADLIGRTRASILTLLAEPATTTTLATRLRLTPGAISHHLSVLHANGLISRTRVSQGVLYRRTARGKVLIE